MYTLEQLWNSVSLAPFLVQSGSTIVLIQEKIDTRFIGLEMTAHASGYASTGVTLFLTDTSSIWSMV